MATVHRQSLGHYWDSYQAGNMETLHGVLSRLSMVTYSVQKHWIIVDSMSFAATTHDIPMTSRSDW